MTITPCGHSSNVKTLFKHAEQEGWKQTYFLVDGDNEGNPFPGRRHFIHLEKYCIENYLLDTAIAAAALGITEETVRAAIMRAILYNRPTILGKNKFLDFLLDGLAQEHVHR